MNDKVVVTSVHYHEGQQAFRHVLLKYKNDQGENAYVDMIWWEDGRFGVETKNGIPALWYNSKRRIPQEAIMDFFLQLMEVPYQQGYEYTKAYNYDD